MSPFSPRRVSSAVGLLQRTLLFFFFTDTATTEIYTLSLHDALPISRTRHHDSLVARADGLARRVRADELRRFQHRCRRDRKSTRLNSSHANISYAVFCLKKKKAIQRHLPNRTLAAIAPTTTPCSELR